MRKLDLTLGRIRRLGLFRHGQGFAAVHVAGTNGKGSICIYLSHMLARARLGWGRFTSPYSRHPSEAVVLNGIPMDPASWNARRAALSETYSSLRTQGGPPNELSPFETETAVALSTFRDDPGVNIAVVEAGLGGLTDATNILSETAVTVVSKIGLDHTEYLGTTLAAIASRKAGIMRPRTPCVVDGTNDEKVLHTLREHAASLDAPLYLTTDPTRIVARRPWGEDMKVLDGISASRGLAPFQRDNLSAALLAMRLVLSREQGGLPPGLESGSGDDGVAAELVGAALDGGGLQARLDWVRLPAPRNRTVLVDGAHNALGTAALGAFIRERIRKPDRENITWIVALSDSRGKNPTEVLGNLGIRPRDRFAAVEYQARDGEGLPEPVKPGVLLDAATGGRGRGFFATADAVYDGAPRLEDALEWAATPREGQIVITGSLYMTRRFYDLLESMGK